VSTDDQMSIEDRVRTAARAGASLIRDVRPLGAPAPARVRRRPEPAPRRWVNWGVPLAAAAAVAVIALTLVAVRQPGHPSPAASRPGTAAPAAVPRYYVASTYDAATGRNGSLIVGDDLTGKVIDTVSGNWRSSQCPVPAPTALSGWASTRYRPARNCVPGPHPRKSRRVSAGAHSPGSPAAGG